MKIISKLSTLIMTTMVLLSLFVIVEPALAQVTFEDLGGTEVEDAIDLANTDPRTTASRIINIALGLLAIITVGIILAGGFMWMTAMGNDEKAGDARKMIIAGVIGLAIVLAAWGIATFVLNSLVTATQS